MLELMDSAVRYNPVLNCYLLQYEAYLSIDVRVNIWSSSSDSASNSRLGYWLGLYAALAVIEASALIFSVL